MKSLYLQEEENKLLSTIISCIQSDNNLKSKISVNNTQKLFESINGFYTPEIQPINNQVKFSKFNKNKLAYFQEVSNYIKNSRNNVQLNESIYNINQDLDIDLFEISLQLEIKSLLKNNDFDFIDTLPDTVLKTKILLNKPINIYGFNIISNLHLVKLLEEKFKIDSKEIFSIIYEKSNKLLLFVLKNRILAYDIKTNNIDYIQNIIDFNEYQINLSLLSNINKLTYIKFIKDNISNNIVELFVSIEDSKLVFEEGLFREKTRIRLFGKTEKSKENFFVKQ